MKTKILLVGGAGYIGTIVTKFFLKKNYKITCLDNLIYENKFSINEFLLEKNYEFIFGDLRNEKILRPLIDKNDIIIILAGLVGDPITKKYPDVATQINYDGIKNLIVNCEKKKTGKIIFVSTCSNYGLSDSNDLLDENAKLQPLSLYAKHKVEIEKYILSLKNKVNISPTILRFSTAFGLSPRMRFDLTINQFTKSIYNKEKLEVFDSNTWRPYCHVSDFALALEKVIEADHKLTSFEVFNVGGDKNNFTKKQITELVLKSIPNAESVSYTDKKLDPRNYRVDFSKIDKKLDFKIKYSVEDGIEEIVDYLKDSKISMNKLNSDLYGNYLINL
jgi:nucleoside-diphosphate-sugar epimerase